MIHNRYIPNILIFITILMSISCTNYDAEPFTGYTLPRITGYSTGVTNDWLYLNLRTGAIMNASAPSQDIAEGQQKNRTDWDLAFCGYRMRTNSGTSGIGNGGAADLGYSTYDQWTSKSQLDKITWTADNDSTVFITMSQNDWNKYLLAHKMPLEDNPWFDPNEGPKTMLSSANPVLAGAITFTAPPPTYTPSYHTYAIRSADGQHFYKLQIVSWYDEKSEIGDTGGRMSYYLDEIK